MSNHVAISLNCLRMAVGNHEEKIQLYFDGFMSLDYEMFENILIQ